MSLKTEATFINFTDWSHMLVRWMWQVAGIFLFFELFLFAFFKPVPECNRMLYFCLFVLTPSIGQGVVLMAMEIINRYLYSRIGERWVFFLTLGGVTAFFGVMVGVHSSVSEMGALLVYPIFLANVYRQRKYILIQGVLSFIALIIIRFLVIPNAVYKPYNSEFVITTIFLSYIVGSIYGTLFIQKFVVQMDTKINVTMDKENKMKELVRQDSLTCLLNHKAFYDELKQYIDRSIQMMCKVSLLVIDIDDFKKINDEFGHVNGDKVIVELASILKNNIREVDIAARYGGEEFAVILWDIGVNEAKLVADNIRNQFNIYDFGAEFQNKHFSISVGIAEYGGMMKTVEDFLKAADYALYTAKRNGKNVVINF